MINNFICTDGSALAVICSDEVVLKSEEQQHSWTLLQLKGLYNLLFSVCILPSRSECEPCQDRILFVAAKELPLPANPPPKGSKCDNESLILWWPFALFLLLRPC